MPEPPVPSPKLHDTAFTPSPASGDLTLALNVTTWPARGAAGVHANVAEAAGSSGAGGGTEPISTWMQPDRAARSSHAAATRSPRIGVTWVCSFISLLGNGPCSAA